MNLEDGQVARPATPFSEGPPPPGARSRGLRAWSRHRAGRPRPSFARRLRARLPPPHPPLAGDQGRGCKPFSPRGPTRSLGGRGENKGGAGGRAGETAERPPPGLCGRLCPAPRPGHRRSPKVLAATGTLAPGAAPGRCVPAARLRCPADASVPAGAVTDVGDTAGGAGGGGRGGRAGRAGVGRRRTRALFLAVPPNAVGNSEALGCTGTAERGRETRKPLGGRAGGAGSGAQTQRVQEPAGPSRPAAPGPAPGRPWDAPFPAAAEAKAGRAHRVRAASSPPAAGGGTGRSAMPFELHQSRGPARPAGGALGLGGHRTPHPQSSRRQGDAEGRAQTARATSRPRGLGGSVSDLEARAKPQGGGWGGSPGERTRPWTLGFHPSAVLKHAVTCLQGSTGGRWAEAGVGSSREWDSIRGGETSVGRVGGPSWAPLLPPCFPRGCCPRGGSPLAPTEPSSGIRDGPGRGDRRPESPTGCVDWTQEGICQKAEPGPEEEIRCPPLAFP